MQIDTSKLLAVLVENFDEEELQTLCFELKIEYESLPAQGKANKARELVVLCERQRRLPELVTAVLEVRPRILPNSLQRDTSHDQSPFKGLLVFEEGDADIFFGRETFITTLVTHLLQSPANLPSSSFLALVGASGSGKSSIARAGLIPTIRQQTDWPIHLITPTTYPLESLATTLTRDSESVTATTTLMDDMIRDRRSLHLYVRRLLSKGSGEQRSEEESSPHPPISSSPYLFLLVDQFEELFTLCRDEGERRVFVDNLVTAVEPETAGRTIVVITLRADFYSHCLGYETLHKLLEGQQKIVPVMSQADLRAAMLSPAAKAGLTFEDGLVDLILRDLGATETGSPEPGALPLLSHVLLETWRRREGSWLTLAGYTEAGGVHGAIAKTAESTFQRLTSAQQTIARDIFLRLTELGEGTQDTRRRVGLDELLPQSERDAEVAGVLKTLADARLVTTSRETDLHASGDTDEMEAAAYAEVAHEALIREWPTLQHWLDEDREGLRIHRQLTEAAAAWQVHDQDESYLYQGARLEAAREWTDNESTHLNQLEQAFLTASRQRQQDELAVAETRARRIRRLAYGLAVALVLAMGAVIFAFAQLRTAQARQLLTQAQVKFMEDDFILATLLALESNDIIKTKEAADLLEQFRPSPCHWVGRNLTEAEWRQYKAPFAWTGSGAFLTDETVAGQLINLIGLPPYRPTCLDLPVPDVAPILTMQGKLLYGGVALLVLGLLVLLLFGLYRLVKKYVLPRFR